MQGHNADDAVSRKRIRRKLGEQVPSAKLNPEKVRWIRNQHAAGVTKAEMARQLGVSPVTVHNVLNGTSWRHI
jgi:DNA-binding XRE family transcriptional regulator